jgi:hypothetical protein
MDVSARTVYDIDTRRGFRIITSAIVGCEVDCDRCNSNYDDDCQYYCCRFIRDITF